MREWFVSMCIRIAALLRRRRLDRDLRDEVAFHVAMREGQLRAAGEDDAALGARRRFGSATRIHEELRETWAVAPRLAAVGRDLRLAVRTLRRSSGFAAIVVLTLGVGIGINTATFSIVNAVLIRPLEFPRPDRLVAIEEHLAGFGFEGGPMSPPDYLDLVTQQTSFGAVAAYASHPVELSDRSDPVRIEGAKVSGSLFHVLGVAPLLGRVLTEQDDRPGVAVAVLSWGLWQSRYGGDPTVVGRAIAVDRQPHTIVGVMPAAFEFPRRGLAINGTPADLWLPLAFSDQQRQARGNEFRYGAIGRLADGVSLERARAELTVLAERIDGAYPPGLKNAGFAIDFSAKPLQEAVSGSTERPLLLIMGAVGLVLLVTCTNVGNLVLNRAASRAREMAVRTALGASRGRLVQLLLVEAALLALLGGALGLALSRLVVRVIPAAVMQDIPAVREIPVDGRVLAFTGAVAMATAILFALLPLVSMQRDLPGAALQAEASRTTAGRRRHRLQAGLVVSTVTLAFVLLVGAGLLVRSFSALMISENGFGAEHVLTASFTLPRAGYGSADAVRAFHARLLDSAASLPGVRAAALVTDLPFDRYERRTVTPEGMPAGSDVPRNTHLSWVHGPYFETFEVDVRRGRVFSTAEFAEARRVVVVNARLARTFWPEQDPIGKRLRWGLDVPQNTNPWLTVIGVVADVADAVPGVEPFLHAYEPFSQFPDFVLDNVPTTFGRHVKVAARTDADPVALAPALRSRIRRLDAELPIDSLITMNDRLGDIVAPRRFGAMTLSAFAAGALALAALGLYGLLAFQVAERRREVAVRLALGAEPPAIVRMVVAQGAKLTALGLVVGGLVSIGAARGLGSVLYRTEPHDAVTFAAVPIVLGTIALAACALPAWRASRVHPSDALRSE